MFVDLVGSTALSARLDPEDMRTVITGYQNTVAGVVTRFEGHVAKYMGTAFSAISVGQTRMKTMPSARCAPVLRSRPQ